MLQWKSEHGGHFANPVDSLCAVHADIHFNNTDSPLGASQALIAAHLTSLHAMTTVRYCNEGCLQ